ncbi:uncharacterized protein ARMOST_14241 [Armillaria ostoyae]|uniref:DUF6535 domain-containing protein n=1 Tax=Armillaria ostoyae TaxID=47428 RepID=A0A284RQ05_ARMOS|nr:uncharacterized protein ARMOST_14241 [Armillaria ostoyae]
MNARLNPMWNLNKAADSSTRPETKDGEEENVNMLGTHPLFATHFGLRQHRRRSMSFGRQGPIPDDYTTRYPKDPIGEEMSANGRFWRTYTDEALIIDGEMVDVYHDTINVLLVFAGLFSAVLTTFVIQTSQNLRPDYTEVSASLLIELVELQRAANVSSIPSSPFYPSISFSPSSADVWLNSLWFVSLTLSLITALVAVLVKQWLHQYISVISDILPRDRGSTRQYRYMGLMTWQVPMIIGLLPVLLHISLGLFFAGLSIYLFALDIAIAYIVAAISATAYVAYVACLVLPLFYHNCPYKTPLMLHLPGLYHAARGIVSRLITGASNKHMEKPRSIKDVERIGAFQAAAAIDSEAVSWLYSASSNTSVKQIVLQAVLGIRIRNTVDVDNAVGRIFDQLGGLEPDVQHSIVSLPLPRPHSNSPSRANPFRDTTASLLAIIRSPMLENVVLPQSLWVSILKCTDWRSPSAIHLAVELMEIWKDNLLEGFGDQLPADTDTIGHWLDLAQHYPICSWDASRALSAMIRLFRVELTSNLENNTHGVNCLLYGGAYPSQATYQATSEQPLPQSEMAARTDSRTISSSRIFPTTLSAKGRLALLHILTFHDGIPLFKQAEIFYTNAIRCLLSPASLDDSPFSLKQEYWELEWRLLEELVAPFLFPDDIRILLRVFIKEGGLPALYTRFANAHRPGLPRQVPARFASQITNGMVDIDAFSPLHLAGSSTNLSFVDSLSKLTRLLLHVMDWHSITRLLERLHRTDISESMWEEYFTQLCQWTTDNNFRYGGEFWHCVYVVARVRRIHAMLPIQPNSLMALPQYGFVSGGENFNALQRDRRVVSNRSLRDSFMIEGDYIFAPFAIPYNRLIDLLEVVAFLL